MIASDHFVMLYNEIFKFLGQQKPDALDRYYARIADRQAFFTLDAWRRSGLDGVCAYYERIKFEENCDMDIVRLPDSVQLRMRRCPSLSKALDSDAGPCSSYCDHCPGWVLRVMGSAGFWEVYDLVSRTAPVCNEYVFVDRERARAKRDELVAIRGSDLVRSNVDSVPPFVSGCVADSDRFRQWHPRFTRAFEFLKTTNLSTLRPGRHEVDGDRIFVNIMDVDLVPFGQGEIEAHRKYIDIHVPISGPETIGAFTLWPEHLVLPFHKEYDYVLLKGRTTPLTLSPGEFVAFFPPTGGHAPGQTVEVPRKHRKAVVKVLYD